MGGSILYLAPLLILERTLQYYLLVYHFQVSVLEQTFAEKQHLHKSLQSQADEVKEEHSSTERELGGERKVLMLKEQQLRVGVHGYRLNSLHLVGVARL